MTGPVWLNDTWIDLAVNISIVKRLWQVPHSGVARGQFVSPCSLFIYNYKVSLLRMNSALTIM